MKLTTLAAAMIVLGVVSAPVLADDSSSNTASASATTMATNSSTTPVKHKHIRSATAQKAAATEDNTSDSTAPAAAPTEPTTDYADILFSNSGNRAQDSVGGPLSDWYKHIGISGYILANAKTQTSTGENTQSSFYSRGSELYFDAQANDWVAGHLTLAYGQDNFNAGNYANNTTGPNGGNQNGIQPWTVYVPEATIGLANLNKSPLWLTAGRQEFLFGSYMRNTISGSLVRALTDTDDNGLTVGYTSMNGAHAELFAAQGPNSASDQASAVRVWGANVGYSELTDDLLKYNVDVGYENNLYESYWIADSAPQFVNGNGNTDPAYHKQVPGLALHLDATSGPFQFITDFATALTGFSPYDLPEGTYAQSQGGYPVNGPVAPFTSEGAKPWAYMLETSYGFPVLNYDTRMILGYQQSGDAVNIMNPLALGGYQMPQYRYIASYAIDITKDLSVQVEYRHDIDYKTSQGGDGQSDNVGLAQLGLIF